MRTCVRERKFSRKYFWKRNRLYPQEKREKKKLRQKEKDKKIKLQASKEILESFKSQEAAQAVKQYLEKISKE